MNPLTQIENENRKLLERRSVVNMDEIMARERQERERHMKCRTVAWQILVFIICFLKMFMMSNLQGMLTFGDASITNMTDQLRLMFVFGMLVIGNVIDNMSYVKPLVVFLDFFLAICWLNTGLRIYKSLHIYGHCDGSVLHSIGILDQIPSSGLMLISIIQVYNWFQNEVVGLALIYYYSAQYLGYLVPIPFLEECYKASQPKFYYIFASVMFAFGILEIWTFTFIPLQKNIIINKSETSLNSGQPRQEEISFGNEDQYQNTNPNYSSIIEQSDTSRPSNFTRSGRQSVFNVDHKNLETLYMVQSDKQ